MLLDDAQHFVRGPDWTWYILFYFFFAGLSGGSYAIASLLRVFGKREDEPAARLGYYTAFVALLPCPVLLTLDLGQPIRFWHMLVNTTPGEEGLSLKYWSPMSVGAWGLVLFSVFAGVSFVDALGRDGKRLFGFVTKPLAGWFGKLWATLGLLAGLFIAGYTGVLLSVSNQPVWSDTWALGGLFLASGLSGSAALMAWLIRFRKAAQPTMGVFTFSERYFQVLELALIVIFAVTLIPAGMLSRAFGMPWSLLWLVAFAGLASGLISGLAPQRPRTSDLAPDSVTSVPAPDGATSGPAPDGATSGLAADSVTNGPASNSVTIEPAPDSVTSGPALDSVTSGPAADSVTNGPAADSVTSEPAPDSVTSGPAADGVTNGPAPLDGLDLHRDGSADSATSGPAPQRTMVSAEGTAVVRRAHAATMASLIVLIGVLALRAAIIFSAQ
jgi:formate-dependent nitrite reductase membrane component NrfD